MAVTADASLVDELLGNISTNWKSTLYLKLVCLSCIF